MKVFTFFGFVDKSVFVLITGRWGWVLSGIFFSGAGSFLFSNFRYLKSIPSPISGEAFSGFFLW
jgi:hypothetical protein